MISCEPFHTVSFTLTPLTDSLYSASGFTNSHTVEYKVYSNSYNHHNNVNFFIPETGKKKDSLLPDAIDVADNLQYWPERQGSLTPLRFSHIAALHSELVAVSTTGQLYQWRWADKDPYVHPEVIEI